MKVLFLDFDGVINNANTFEKKRGMKFANRLDYRRADLEPELIARIKKVIEQTGAKIVVSSSWRNGWSLNELNDLFKPFEISFVGVTPTLDVMDQKGLLWLPMSRGAEIERWLAEHLEVTKYAVIDDSSDAKYGHEDRFVQTNFISGIQEKHVQKLIDLLTD